MEWYEKVGTCAAGGNGIVWLATEWVGTPGTWQNIFLLASVSSWFAAVAISHDSKKPYKPKKSDTYVPKGSPTPPPSKPEWCKGCDGIYPRVMMAWDLDGDDYLCGYCLGMPKVLAVLWMWDDYLQKMNVPAPINTGATIDWPGLGGPAQHAYRRFDHRGLEINFGPVLRAEPENYADNRGDDVAWDGPVRGEVERYRAAGVTVTYASNEAYKDRLARRQAERKRNGHWEWTGMGREWQRSASRCGRVSMRMTDGHR